MVWRVIVEPLAVHPVGGVPTSILGLVTKFKAGSNGLSKLIKSSAVLAEAKVTLMGMNLDKVPTDSLTVRHSCSENRYSNPRSIGISSLRM